MRTWRTAGIHGSRLSRPRALGRRAFARRDDNGENPSLTQLRCVSRTGQSAMARANRHVERAIGNLMDAQAATPSDKTLAGRPILIVPYLWIGDFVRCHTAVRLLNARF